MMGTSAPALEGQQACQQWAEALYRAVRAAYGGVQRILARWV